MWEVDFMAAKRVDCFFLDVDDKPGVVAEFARQLRDAKINLKGLWAYTSANGRGKIGCVPQNAKKFIERAKELGLTTSQSVAFYASGTDKVGALCKVLDSLDKASVNIKVMDAIGFSGRYGAYVWVDPQEVENATKVLGA
jgi:hypothetical protein